MSSIAPLAFTGASKYSADFQTILNRTVKIASQPISFLQNQQTKLLQQKQLAINLNGGAQSVANALEELGGLGETKALVASSSNSSKVSINSTTANSPATYTISEVTSIAHAASATSTGFADASAAAVSVTGNLKLTFGGIDYAVSLTPEQNNLTGLRNAINNLGVGVNASILTTGTGANPFYLSLTANATGFAPKTASNKGNMGQRSR